MTAAEPETGEGATRRADRAIGLGLGALYAAALFATARPIGLARDEGFYAVAAQVYGRWLRSLVSSPSRAISGGAVDAAWQWNHEHPPLIKGLFAVSYEVFHRWLGIADVATSVRAPAILLAASLVALVYVWGARAAGRFAGVVAAVSLAAMPRVFFNAHLACFDVPITAMFFATVHAFVRASDAPSRGNVLCAALLFGLSLASKHNAWFLPPLFVASAAVFAAWSWRTRDPVLPAVRGPVATLALSLIVGPLVLWALWPWIWREPVERLAEYVRFHLHHEFYNMEFLGETYWRPPFPRTYAPLMTAATVPTITLVLAAVGFAARARDALGALRLRSPGSLATCRAPLVWTLAILVSYGSWVRDATPIFGGTKHWMTAYPFLALFAGVGAELVRRAIVSAWPPLASRAGRATATVLAALLVAPSVVSTMQARSFGTTAYVPLVGGAPGAATLGLNRGFWGTQTGALVPWLDDSAPQGAHVYAHDTLGASWDVMQRDGLIRRDIRRVGWVHDADLAVQHHEMHMQGQEYQAWIAFGTTRPEVVMGPDGVPVVLLYRRRDAP
jgi:4-amino-4-deoxy-L-arabinose transferase-like glycosyltransferase